jgi:hypothetical protein
VNNENSSAPQAKSPSTLEAYFHFVSGLIFACGIFSFFVSTLPPIQQLSMPQRGALIVAIFAVGTVTGIMYKRSRMRA